MARVSSKPSTTAPKTNKAKNVRNNSVAGANSRSSSSTAVGSGKTNASITDQQWDEFAVVWNTKWARFFPKPSVNDPSSSENDNHLLKYHKMWIKVFRDNFSDALGFELHSSHRQLEKQSTNEIVQFTFEKLTTAVEHFDRARDKMKSKQQRDSSYQFFTDEEILIDVDLSICFVTGGKKTADNKVDDERSESLLQFKFALDVGRLLGYLKEPESNSWEFAGKSHQMMLFCKFLHNRLVEENSDFNDVSDDGNGRHIDSSEEESLDDYHHHLLPTTTTAAAATSSSLLHLDDDKPEAFHQTGEQVVPAANNSSSSSFIPRTVTSNYLRITVLRLWAEKYDHDGVSFNRQLMLNDWLLEAIADYEHHANHEWLAIKSLAKTIPSSWISSIRFTAEKTWIDSITSKARSASRKKPPGTNNWVADALDGDLRLEWEAYYSLIISEKKIQAPSTARQKNAESKSEHRKRRIAEAINESREDEEGEGEEENQKKPNRLALQHSSFKDITREVSDNMNKRAEEARERSAKVMEQLMQNQAAATIGIQNMSANQALMVTALQDLTTSINSFTSEARQQRMGGMMATATHPQSFLPQMMASSSSSSSMMYPSSSAPNNFVTSSSVVNNNKKQAAGACLMMLPSSQDIMMIEGSKDL